MLIAGSTLESFVLKTSSRDSADDNPSVNQRTSSLCIEGVGIDQLLGNRKHSAIITDLQTNIQESVSVAAEGNKSPSTSTIHQDPLQLSLQCSLTLATETTVLLGSTTCYKDTNIHSPSPTPHITTSINYRRSDTDGMISLDSRQGNSSDHIITSEPISSGSCADLDSEVINAGNRQVNYSPVDSVIAETEKTDDVSSVTLVCYGIWI